MEWHRQTLDRIITEHRIPWWQWDEGCYATDHGHLPGNVSYVVYRNIQHTTAELKRRHPGLWLVGISVFQHQAPWILRTVDETVSWGGPWYAHNFLFMPPGKTYIGDYQPRTKDLEYDLLWHLGIADHINVGQPIWFADAAKRKTAQNFWRKWLAWADAHSPYLRVRRDLFGPPDPDTLEDSAHILIDRGFLFLFNSGQAEKAGSNPAELSDRTGCRRSVPGA